ncbi:unnamed protein product [Trichobilharzia regenti]|nr:unnamed protein product [Trichobilharzia regenti]
MVFCLYGNKMVNINSAISHNSSNDNNNNNNSGSINNKRETVKRSVITGITENSMIKQTNIPVEVVDKG